MTPSHETPLALTGERTAPEHPLEQYWFARHEAAYEWSAELIRQTLLTTTNTNRGGEFTEANSPIFMIVDAGSGEGYGANLLANSSSDLGTKVIGLELDMSAVEHANARYGKSFTTLVANLDAWPLPSNSADFVVSMQVVEHLWNLSQFMSEANRVLKPGGMMILTTPNRLTFSPGLSRGEKPTNPFHVEEFDIDQLASLVEQAKFTNITRRGLHHCSGLKNWEATNGDLVSLQMAAAVAATDQGTDWPTKLADKVQSIANNDFEINSTSLDMCADLVLTATKATYG